MLGISQEYRLYSCIQSKLGTSLEAINGLFYFCGTGNSMQLNTINSIKRSDWPYNSLPIPMLSCKYG